MPAPHGAEATSKATVHSRIPIALGRAVQIVVWLGTVCSSDAARYSQEVAHPGLSPFLEVEITLQAWSTSSGKADARVDS
jgi:hypothetical protein